MRAPPSSASRRIAPSSSVAASRSSREAPYQPSVAATSTRTRYGGSKSGSVYSIGRTSVPECVPDIETSYDILYGRRVASDGTHAETGGFMNGKRAVRWGAVVSLVAVLAAVAGGSTARGASQDGYT